jgi:tetratricopeptide (TPR) repeat protein
VATGLANEAVRGLLAEYGLTEEMLAEAVNERAWLLFGRYGTATGRSVRYWLSGQVRWPHPCYLLALEDIFGRPALELGFVPRGKSSVPVLAATRRRVAKLGKTPAGQEFSVLRREFFVVAAGTLLDIGVTPLPVSGRIGMASAATVHDTIGKLHAYDDLRGGAGLADVTERYITHVQDAMGRCIYSPRVEAALYEATGELAASAGWFCFDAGNMARARRFFETALTSADLANSRVLKARIWCHLSRQAVELHRGAEAVTMARRALETTRADRDPRLSALLHSRVALGHACQGEAGRAGRALVLAETAFDRPAGDPPAWLVSFGPAEILTQASLSHHQLGDLDQAEHLQRQALALLPAAFQRNRFTETVHLAACQFDARRMPDAAASGNEALNLLPMVRSGLWTRKLGDLRQHLEPYRRDTHVSAFIERCDASLPAA